MAARRLLSLVGCLLLTALPGHQCFQWQSNPADGATLNVFAGDDVTIPWTYTADTGDVISGVNWFFRGGSEEIVAMFTHSMFMALPAFSGRVQQANNGGGLTLKHVTLGDSGTYSVEVTGQDANGHAFTQRRSVDLHVTNRATPFQWTGNALADGQTLNAPEGYGVVIPWSYTTGPGVVISGVTWFFKSGSEAIMAETIHGQFVVLPDYTGRLQQENNAGITLNRVTVSDSGTYIVEVTGHDADGNAFTQRRSLVLHVSVAVTTTPPPTTVNGQWGSWGSYGSCSTTCGDGTKTRTRTCDNPAPAYGGAACVGSYYETATCKLQECPVAVAVDGQWGSWGSYGSCSKTCGDGIKTRSRSCNNPAAAHGGAYCTGSFYETAICNLQECPATVAVNGQWGYWGSYGSCSTTCGDGTQTRTRTCDNPAPAYGGAYCTGSYYETATCNLQECLDHHGDSPDKSTFHDTGNLLWKDCGENSAWITIQNFDMTPHPLHIPGQGTFTLQATNGIAEVLDGNTAMVVTIKKFLLNRWVGVPCTGPTFPTDQRLGSCTYSDICTLFESWFIDASCQPRVPWIPWVADFYSHGFPCSCPFSIPAQKHIDFNNEPVSYAPPDEALTWLTTGEYYLKLAMYERGSVSKRMCLELIVDLNPH